MFVPYKPSFKFMSPQAVREMPVWDRTGYTGGSPTINILNVRIGLVSGRDPQPSDPFHLDFLDVLVGWPVVWIEFGPLLRTSSGVAQDLGLDEIVSVIDLVGFEFLSIDECGGSSARL